MKTKARIAVMVLLLAAVALFGWGTGLALLWMVPCGNRFVLGTPCGVPTLLTYASALPLGAAILVAAWPWLRGGGRAG